jgi:NADP-reducing hydrogenase subunit HndD
VETKMVNLKINGIDISAKEGDTVLEAARSANIQIPTLCYLKGVNEIGACRMCLVEIKGARALQASCVYPVAEGIEVFTNTKLVRDTRRTNLELILSDHNRECTSCIRSSNCELQALSKDLGVEEVSFQGEISGKLVEVNDAIVRDESKCVYCKRCIAVCSKVQGVGALGATERGFHAKARPVFGLPLDSVSCISCGQCVINCPVGALKERDSIHMSQSYLDDPEMHAIAVIAPAVRAAIGEEFGYPIGSDVTGKMVAATRRLGFDKVFDVSFSADLTIMEEGTELIGRVTKGGVLPMITSCSPGWINYCEKHFPGQLAHLSSCKSPQGMLGALIKTHYAKVRGIDPDKIKVVSVMPCTAKKTEFARPQLASNGRRDIDEVVTTRELARMIKGAGVAFEELAGEGFDEFYGDSTGAAVIFGSSGGVMEAALRTAVEFISGKPSEKIDYPEAREASKGIREFEIAAGDLVLKGCIVSGGANIKEVMELVASGSAPWHFIEIMACPGGCVNGGGQPIVSSKEKVSKDVRGLRAKVLYTRDSDVLEFRKSHENQSVAKLYSEFLGEPNGHLSHELLHTTYSAKPKYRPV